MPRKKITVDDINVYTVFDIINVPSSNIYNILYIYIILLYESHTICHLVEFHETFCQCFMHFW